MPLIISPKTTRRNLQAFTEAFSLRKTAGRFWHGNFNDAFYTGLDSLVNVIFTGYSGAVAGQALLEYASTYLAEDKRPEVFFIGSIYAFRNTPFEPGDIVYARDSYSPDSYEQAIYDNALHKGISDIWKPHHGLMEKTLAIAHEKGLRFNPGKVYCRISPGYFPQFTQPSQLMDEGMWWKVSQGLLDNNGCDSGEYESAAVLATSRLLHIPAIALYDVKDKRYSDTDYRLASPEQKKLALESMLLVAKETILRT